MTEDDRDTSGYFDELTRRNMVKTGAVTGVIGLSGGTAMALNNSEQVRTPTDDTTAPPPEPGDLLDIGGRVIAGEVGYPTIQQAFDAADDGDTVYVHSSYNAVVGQEDFPIVLDLNEKQVSLVGGHPSGSVIDAEHAPDENVIEVYGQGSHDYRSTPLIQNLQIVGGNVGIQVVGAPNASFSHLKLFRTTSHGVHITRLSDDDNGSFGTRWYDCEAWSCGGSGFKVNGNSSPHGTTFIRCNATWNGWNGGHPGVELSGYSSVWEMGTIQSNSAAGILLHSGGSQVIRDTYFESNGFEIDEPTHIHAEGTLGLTIDACYFLGGMLNASSLMENVVGHDQVCTAVTLYDARTTTLENCSHRNHESGFVAVAGDSALDNDINEASHHNISDSDTFVVEDGGSRTRSNGTIREQDLHDIDGGFVGDQGIHDGSGGGTWGPYMWNGSAWVSEIDGNSL